MDPDRLIGRLPPNRVFQAMRRADQKDVALAFIGSIIDAIEAEKREPDEWEAGDIRAGIGFAADGMYTASICYAERALTPIEERAPKENQPKMEGEKPSILDLRRAADIVDMTPANPRV